MMCFAGSIGAKNKAAEEAGSWFQAGFAFGWESIQHQGNGTGDQFREQFEQGFDDEISDLADVEALSCFRAGRDAGENAWMARRDAGLTPKLASEVA